LLLLSLNAFFRKQLHKVRRRGMRRASHQYKITGIGMQSADLKHAQVSHSRLYLLEGLGPGQKQRMSNLKGT
jgi:hypothetical protein